MVAKEIAYAFRRDDLLGLIWMNEGFARLSSPGVLRLEVVSQIRHVPGKRILDTTLFHSGEHCKSVEQHKAPRQLIPRLPNKGGKEKLRSAESG